LVVNIQRAEGDRIVTIPLDGYKIKVKLPLMDQVSTKEWVNTKAAQEEYSSDEIIDCFVTKKVAMWLLQYFISGSMGK